MRFCALLSVLSASATAAWYYGETSTLTQKQIHYDLFSMALHAPHNKAVGTGAAGAAWAAPLFAANL